MVEYIVSGFYLYYGLDWASFLLGVYGMYSLSEKKKVGFIFQVLASICAIVCSYWAGQFGFIMSNAVMMGVAGYGFWNWNKDKKEFKKNV